MRTSNKFKRILLPLLVAIFFMAGVFAMRFLLTDATGTEILRYGLSQIDAAGEDVDMLMIGGSRTYRSLDPDIFEEELGLTNAINQGTPSQRPLLSYYLLESFLKKYHPKYLILGATYNGLTFSQDPHTLYYAIDRLDLESRFKCAIDHFGINDGLLTLAGKSEYMDNMSISSMINNVKSKITRSNGIDDIQNSVLKDNGYKGSLYQCTPGSITFEYDKPNRDFSTDLIKEEAFEYYDKIVKTCQAQGVEVILFSGPCSMRNIYGIPNYQQATDFYTEYAEKNGIKYFNLNYIKNREELFSDDMFEDYMHLNYYGSQKCSKLFAKILKEHLNGENTDHYFYKNVDELKSDVNRIVSCACKVTCDNDFYLIQCKTLHNEGIQPEYRLLATKDNDEGTQPKEYVDLRGWDYADSFKIPCEELDEYLNIKVEARINDNDNNCAFTTCYLRDVK